jgi:hypothetical protein
MTFGSVTTIDTAVEVDVFPARSVVFAAIECVPGATVAEFHAYPSPYGVCVALPSS